MIQQDIYIAGEPIGQGFLDAIAERLGGYTIIPTTGGWRDEDGDTVTEAAYIIRTFGKSAPMLDHVLALVTQHARNIGEAEVLVVHTLVDSFRTVTV